MLGNQCKKRLKGNLPTALIKIYKTDVIISAYMSCR